MQTSDLERRAVTLIDTDRLVRDTCDLIRGRGENPGGTEAETVLRLAAICARAGAKVTTQEWAPGRANLLATVGPVDGPAILFLGHSDVVPAGEGWTGDPFTPRVTDGTIVGRGSSDMKGGLAAVAAAMSAVHQAAPGVRLDLLCTADEEDRARGVLAWLAQDTRRPYIACIVAEPTELDVVIGCRGAINLVVEIVGASAHAGNPDDGASSISAAARLVELVRAKHRAALAGPRDPLLGTPTWNVGTIQGGSGTSIVPRTTTLTLDRRTMPGERPSDILDELLADLRADLRTSGIANADRITATGSVDAQMPGFRIAEDLPLTRVAVNALTDLAVRPAVTGWTAACEGGFVAAFHQVPTMILGPGSITTQAHQPDEHVRIDQLDIAARAYALIAIRLALAEPTDGRPRPR